MSNLLKKLTLSFLSALIVLFSIAPYFLVSAQPASPVPPVPTGSWYNQGFKDWWSKVYDENISPSNEIFGERYTAAQVQWVMYGLWAFILNIVVPQNLTACMLTNYVDIKACADVLTNILSQSNPELEKITKVYKPEKRSLAELVFVADRPFSGISYVKEKIDSFSPVQAVSAQAPGFGYNMLKPVQDMWKGTRDVAFGLFIVAAIALAFMIMFRLKISPQVVISIQSAIPKLIVSLILVTFSYAIAGFLIDLMYIVIGLFSLIAVQFLPFNPDPVNIFNFLTLGQPFSSNQTIGIIGLMIGYLILLPLAFVIVIFGFLGILQSALLGLITAVASAGIVASVAGNILWLVGAVIVLIIVVILIWQTIKTSWMLLKAFANILLLTVFAPLQIVAGTVIPNFGFGAWVRSYVTNLLTFVLTGVLVLLMYIFLALGTKIAMDFVVGGSVGNFIMTMIFGADITGGSLGGQVSGYWPPLLGSGNSGISVGFLFLGTSFVIFTLLPKASDIIASFMAGKPFAYGSAVGEALGPAAMIGGAAADYRAGREKARLETEIRQAENAGDWATAQRLRREIATRDIAGGLIKQVVGSISGRK